MAIKQRNTIDFEDIQERPTILMYRRDGLNPIILHIVKRQGFQQPDGRTEDRINVYITQCNRPLEYVSVYSNSVLPNDWFLWKLCPRCGTTKDFQAALNEYHASFAEQRRKQAEEEARKQAAWERYLADLRQVASVMNTTDLFQAEVDEKHGRVIIKRTEFPEEWLEVTQYRASDITSLQHGLDWFSRKE